jgi:hypothetical protein
MVYICEELGGDIYGWTKSHCTVGERVAGSAKSGNSEQQPPTEKEHTQIGSPHSGWEGRGAQLKAAAKYGGGGSVRASPLNATR